MNDKILTPICIALQSLLYLAGALGAVFCLIYGFDLEIDARVLLLLLIVIGGWCFLIFVWRKYQHVLIFATLLGYIGSGLLFRRELLRGWMGLYNQVTKIVMEHFVVEIPAYTMKPLPTKIEMTLGLLYLLTLFLVALFYSVVLNRHVLAAIFSVIWMPVIVLYVGESLELIPAVAMIVCFIGTAAFGGKKDYGAKLQIALTLVVAMLFTAGATYLTEPVVNRVFASRNQWREELMKVSVLEWIQRKTGIGEGDAQQGQLDHAEAVETSDKVKLQVNANLLPDTSVYLRGFTGQEYEQTAWSKSKEENITEPFAWMYDQVEYLGNTLGNSSAKEIMVLNAAGAESSVYQPYLAKKQEDGSYVYYTYPEYEMFLENTSERYDDGKYYTWVQENYTSVNSEWLPRLAKVVQSHPVSSVEEAEAYVASYVQAQASYDLAPELCPIGDDFVEDFLYVQHKGYCIHFATAAVVMMRLYGYPARYVTGYAALPQEFVKQEDGTYLAKITDETAHSWAEVYEEGAGWMILETTPGYTENVSPKPLTPQDEMVEPETQYETDIDGAKIDHTTEASSSAASGVGSRNTEAGQEQAQTQLAENQSENMSEEESEDESQSLSGPAGDRITWSAWKVIVLVIMICLGLLLLAALIAAAILYRRRKQCLKEMEEWDHAEPINAVMIEMFERMYEMMRMGGLSAAADRSKASFGEQVEAAFDWIPKGDFCNLWQKIMQAGFGQTEGTEEDRKLARQLYDLTAEQIYAGLGKKEQFEFRWIKVYQ